MRLFLIPIEIYDPSMGTIYRGPKYLKWRFSQSLILGLETTKWDMADYGLEPMMLVQVAGTQEQYDLISAQSDVVPFPENLNEQIKPQFINKWLDHIESYNIPFAWVNPSNSYREAIRLISGLFLFGRKIHSSVNLPLVPDGFTMNSPFGDLPQSLRDAYFIVAGKLNLSTDSFRPELIIKQVLQSIGDQMKSRTFYLGGVPI